MKKFLMYLMAIGCVTLYTACSVGDYGGFYGGEPSEGESKGDGEDKDKDKGEGNNLDGGQGNESLAGKVTAGEWNDLENWTFWSELMTGQPYGTKSEYWKIFTNNRVAVSVTNTDDKPIAGAEIELVRKNEQNETVVLWKTISDNAGKADLWVGLFQKELADPSLLKIHINGTEQEGVPQITLWGSEEVATNWYTVTATQTPAAIADVAFIVDATGSMTDEINFLKADLVSIINQVEVLQSSTEIHTAALFYRDIGDQYVTRFSNFTSDLSKTSAYIDAQEAAGGGDYPEAVHTALSTALQALSWDTTARTRIAFLVLDAPPHYTSEIIESIHTSMRLYAEQGIKLIPVAASGVDKNTEFLLRDLAISTGGTYVFLTDDSGVGGEHIKASVGDYQVELLNGLMVRLINKYIE